MWTKMAEEPADADRKIAFMLAAGLAACLLTTGCTRPIRIVPPSPDLPAPLPLPESGTSRIPLPIEIVGPSLFSLKNDIPEVTGGSDPEQSFNYLLWPGDIHSSLEPSGIRLAADVYFYLSLGDPIDTFVQCGFNDEPAQQRSISIRSTIDWHPAWRLQSKSEVSIAPSDQQCRLSIFDIDVTERVNRAVNRAVERAASRLDERIGEASDFSQHAAELWKGMIATYDLENNAFLQMRPSRVVAGPIELASANETSPTRITTTIELEAHPIVNIGVTPEPDLRPLPELEKGVHGKDEFRVMIDADVSFIEANRLLSLEFPQQFEFGKHRVLLCNPVLRPHGGQVVLELELFNLVAQTPTRIDDLVSAIRAGSTTIIDAFRDVLWTTHAKVFLVGTPRFDSVTRDLSFPDLEFDVHTRNEIVRALSWLLRVPLTRELRARTTIHLGERVDDLRTRLHVAMNRSIGERAYLHGYVDRVLGQGIFVGDEVIRVRMAFTGRAFMKGRMTP